MLVKPEGRILDTVQTKTKTMHGIIGHSTTKHYIFYDFANITNPDVVSMAILWKSHFSNMRFSMFRAKFFSDVALPPPVLIHRSGVTTSRYVEKVYHKRNIIGKVEIK